jgi:hypothetical protein
LRLGVSTPHCHGAASNPCPSIRPNNYDRIFSRSLIVFRIPSYLERLFLDQSSPFGFEFNSHCSGQKLNLSKLSRHQSQSPSSRSVHRIVIRHLSAKETHLAGPRLPSRHHWSQFSNQFEKGLVVDRRRWTGSIDQRVRRSGGWWRLGWVSLSSAWAWIRCPIGCSSCEPTLLG